MNISELKIGMKSIDKIEAVVESVNSIRKITSKDGREMKVADISIFDSSGKTNLQLWNEDIEKVRTGSRLRITNGYITTFKERNSLNVGKYGNLEIL